jgi:F-type H+-transporting ATPase subunit b
MDIITPGFGLIFWQFVSFIFVLLILGRFAWRPILGSLKAREDSIAEALEKAEIARQQTENLKMDNEKLLMEARIEREKILNETLSAAEKIRRQAKEDAIKISAKLVNDAKIAITAEKNAALQDVKKIAAEISLDIAEKLIRKNLADKKAQKELVDELLKDVKEN